MEQRARAVIADAYGDWRNVRIGEITLPPPGPDEVLIEAVAASLNFPDLLMIEGRYQYRPKPPFVPGRDVAGRVLAVGAEVRGFAVGDRVAAQPPSGGLATHVLAHAAFCQHVPDTVGFEAAAACGVILATVVGAMRRRANIRPGERVLVTGAAGGVGSAAVQYGRLLGAEIVALVSSAAKEQAVRALGVRTVLRADAIPDLRAGLRGALAVHLPAVDVVIDVVGGDTFDGALRCLAPEGRMVVVGFASGRIPQIPANYLLLKEITVIGSALERLARVGDPAFLAGLAEAWQMLADGRLVAPIERTYRLDDFVAAATRIAERQVTGKLVLTMAG